MSTDNEKTTVLYSPVGADEGQPSAINAIDIIHENNEEYNNKYDREFFRQINHPYYLHTVSISELYDTAYKPKTPIVENLLYGGTYLFVGAPKVGKSFFMAQLAYHVSGVSGSYPKRTRNSGKNRLIRFLKQSQKQSMKI